MSAITLHRTDAARNMHRYYRLDVQPDLFGEWCFVREWGRIGRPRADAQRPLPYRAGSTRRARASAPGQGTAGMRVLSVTRLGYC
jgi:hypothetical protein